VNIRFLNESLCDEDVTEPRQLILPVMLAVSCVGFVELYSNDDGDDAC